MQDPIPNHLDWHPPLPLEGVSLQPWPEEIFPEPFDTFVSELARSTETPIELAAMMTLAVVATAVQNRYLIQIKEDYNEPLNIWPLVILPPASRKSRVYGEVTLPLKRWEQEHKLEMEPLIQAATSKRKTIEARLKELRSQAAKATDDKFQALQTQIEYIENNLPEIPIFPQIWASDVTPEQLGNIMAANGEAMALMSDEGGIFDILAGLYSDGKANIDLFLQAHSASSVRVDRGSRPPIFMERPVLTMGLTVQPEVIRSICNNKTFRGRGLLGRFLYVIPPSNIGRRSFNELPMPQECPQEYQSAIDALLNHPNLIHEDKKTQYRLGISKEAYEKWLEYAQTIEALMGEEIGNLSHITDWAGKLPGAIARVAGLLHVMYYAHLKPWKHQISLKHMSAAIKIGHVLTNHALKAFDLIQESMDAQMARAIYSWIKQEKLYTFSIREANRKFRRFKKDHRGPALDILIDHGIIREFSVNSESKPGRKSELYEVNPHLHDI